MTPKDSKSRIGLFVLGGVLLVFGLVINLAYFNNFPIRSLGLLLLIIGVFLLKSSDFRGAKGARVLSDASLTSGERKFPAPWAWLMGGVSVVALIASVFCLVLDARSGGHERWPADVFAGSVVFGALAWGYIVAKFY